MNNPGFYQTRINKAIDYLNNNLNEEVNIAILSEKSHFSPFHFQRIYKALQNETPYDTLLRLRLERAVFLLKYKSELSLKQIANDAGFGAYENFSRQFKARFKMTPSHFKKNETLHHSRIYQEDHENDFYSCIEQSRSKEIPKFEVKLERIKKIPIAFIRGIFGNDGTELVQCYHELMNWAEANNINYQGKMKRFGMSIDNPEVTPASKYRYDFALNIEGLDLKPHGLIEFGEIPGEMYATVRCSGKLTTIAQAWDFLYKQWLPNSEYVPLNYPAIEEFMKGPEEIGWENFDLKCRIPINKRKK